MAAERAVVVVRKGHRDTRCIRIDEQRDCDVLRTIVAARALPDGWPPGAQIRRRKPRLSRFDRHGAAAKTGFRRGIWHTGRATGWDVASIRGRPRAASA